MSSMADDEGLAVLARLVLRHKALIDVGFGVMNDFARLIEPTLPRCDGHRCKNAATVKHVDTHFKMCDYCAAKAIVLSKRNLTDSLLDAVNLLRLRCADSENWIDLPNATQIRRITEYVFELTKNEEQDPPSDPSERH